MKPMAMSATEMKQLNVVKPRPVRSVRSYGSQPIFTEADGVCVDIIREEPGATSALVADRMGVSTAAAGDRLRKLVVRGTLEVTPGVHKRAECHYTIAGQRT